MLLVETRLLGMDPVIVNDASLLSPNVWVDGDTVELIDKDNNFYDVDVRTGNITPKADSAVGQQP